MESSPASPASTLRRPLVAILLAVAAAATVLLLTVAPGAAVTPGGVTGAVTVEGSSAPVTACAVYLYRVSPTLPQPLFSGGPTTDASGTYNVANLAPGTYKALLLPPFASGRAWQWFNNAGTFAAATTITVSAGATSTANAQLGPEGRISGLLTDAVTGTALAGGRASAYSFDPAFRRWSGGTLWSTWSQWLAATDASGTYTIHNLRPGTYHVRFYSTVTTAAPMLYNAQPDWPEAGTDVAVTADTTTTGINGALGHWAKDAYEPDDSAALAKPATVGAVYWHTLFTGDPGDLQDVDWQSFQAEAGHAYAVETLSLYQTQLTVFDKDATTILGYNGYIDLDARSKVVFRAPSTGRFFVNVASAYWNGPVTFKDYGLKITEVPYKAAAPTGVLAAHPSVLRKNHSTRFSGKFLPAMASRGRTCSLQKLVGSKWRNVAQFTPGSTGSFSFLYREKGAGRWRFRAVMPAGPEWTQAMTPRIWVKWRR